MRQDFAASRPEASKDQNGFKSILEEVLRCLKSTGIAARPRYYMKVFLQPA
jgi:hypothetical protein